MSKGYLYDNGDELIVRAGEGKLPDTADVAPGSTVIVDENGDFTVKAPDLYVAVSYDVTQKKVVFEEGITGKKIKDTDAAGGNVYFIWRVSDGTAAPRPSGYITKFNYIYGSTRIFAVFRILAAIVVGSPTVQYYITGTWNKDTLTDAATYLEIADADIIAI